ncbi:MAG: hypothetical protein WCY11_03720 [Novosphingobium sp.]
MSLILVFLCGIANFMLHKAVLESRHPMLVQMPWFFHALGGRFGLAVEFVMLLGALALVNNGAEAWAVAYSGYTLLNGVSAWLILSGRV